MEAMSTITRFPRPFTDAEVLQELKDRLTETLENTLAAELAKSAQELQDEQPVPYALWPRELRQLAKWVARFAMRLLNPRMRRDGLLHGVLGLIRARHGLSVNVKTLPPAELRQCYFEAKAVLDTHWARMTDGNFCYLDGDTRQKLEQAGRVA